MTHHLVNKNPMSSARRDHIHGRLHQMDEVIKHNLTGFGLVVVICAVAAAFVGMMA